MGNVINSKKFDLEERTFNFAKRVRRLLKSLPNNLANLEDGKQLAKSSGSIGANYIEANESLSKKDFIHRIKICRKESKESIFWLKLLEVGSSNPLELEQKQLTKEASELMMIFSSIYRKSE